MEIIITNFDWHTYLNSVIYCNESHLREYLSQTLLCTLLCESDTSYRYLTFMQTWTKVQKNIPADLTIKYIVHIHFQSRVSRRAYWNKVITIRVTVIAFIFTSQSSVVWIQILLLA